MRPLCFFSVLGTALSGETKGTHLFFVEMRCVPFSALHLSQGRFKAFPIESDDHLYTVLRYVERNPLRATWSSVRRSGAGRVCGGGARATRERGASLRNGLLKNRRIGLGT